jgi:hypothetical protein
MSVDPQFGPVLLFGHGGTATEVILDRSLALPPLNMNLAREMIAGTRINRLLTGYRGVPGADLAEIAATLVKVSQLVCDFPEIVELDINPLLCDPQGVWPWMRACGFNLPRDRPAGAWRSALIRRSWSRTSACPTGRPFAEAHSPRR